MHGFLSDYGNRILGDSTCIGVIQRNHLKLNQSKKTTRCMRPLSIKTGGKNNAEKYQCMEKIIYDNQGKKLFSPS